MCVIMKERTCVFGAKLNRGQASEAVCIIFINNLCVASMTSASRLTEPSGVVKLIDRRTEIARHKTHAVTRVRFPVVTKDFSRRVNRRFPEITGEDNLTVFSYSGRVKSPEWRWQRRRADLRHFEAFRQVGSVT